MQQNYPYHVRDTGEEPKKQPQSRKKANVGLWLAVTAVVLAALAAHLFLHPVVSFRRLPGGFSIVIGAGQDAAGEKKQERSEKRDGGRTTERGKRTSGAAPYELILQPSPSGSEAAAPSGGEGALSLREIYLKVLPSVVTIFADSRGASALGTGVILSEDGYVVTNQHVIGDAAYLRVELNDNRVFDAETVGSDELSDLAVLKITAEGLTPAAFGDSDALFVGDSVAAIGTPLGRGLRGTLTDGIISGISRDLSVSGRKMTLLQTNAALNSGSSGGPLINCYGQVIGINTVKLSTSSFFSDAQVEGLGFAIPAATAKPIVDELIANGYVSGRPALGVQAETLPLRTRFYYSLPEGAYLVGVLPDSDAAAKGLRPGDIVTAVAGTPVSGAEDISGVLAGYSAGDSVEVTFYRARKTQTVTVTLMDRFADRA